MRAIVVVFLCFGAIMCALAQDIHTVQLYGGDENVQYLDVLVNGHKVKFILDTGCSDVSISQEMFDELKAAKAITNASMTRERGKSSMADERLVDYKVFYIDNMTIGDVVLHDIKASILVTPNKKASMLIGHSVLKKFRWYNVKGNELTFELKDSAVLAFQKIEEQAEAIWYKGKSDKKLVEFLKPYLNDYRLTDYCAYMYAWSMMELGKNEEAMPYFEQLLNRRYKISDVLFCMMHCVFADNEKYQMYALQYVDYQLSELGMTEEQLLKTKYKDKTLGNVYYNLSIIAYNNDDSAKEKYYTKIWKNLGYSPNEGKKKK